MDLPLPPHHARLVRRGIVAIDKNLLGNFYINRFNRKIEPLNQRITPFRFKPVPILDIPDVAQILVLSIMEPSLITPNIVAPLPERKKYDPIRLAK